VNCRTEKEGRQVVPGEKISPRKIFTTENGEETTTTDQKKGGRKMDHFSPGEGHSGRGGD